MSYFTTEKRYLLNYLFTVKSDILQFHIIVTVTNYTDISRKMNYNRNRQFGLSIIGYMYMYTIIPRGTLDVYGTSL